MREHLFRGKSAATKEWVYGSLIINGKYEYAIYDCNIHTDYNGEEVIPETVGEYSCFIDKNGNRVFEGDVLRIRQPYRSTQTHEGDNIPNGSYTEPMEPAIHTLEETVQFKDGCFCIYDERYFGYAPLNWINELYDEEMIRGAISYRRDNAEIWDDPEEGDLQYLLQEYKLNDLSELITYLSGFEVIGNTIDNPELLK